ncbi:radical SAM protein, partial [bacterium]|nr:radical SAM protein [bacterium]
GLDSAQVSLEGTTAKTHDTIVNSKGAFEKSLSGIKNLKAAGILTHTNTTITKTNIGECFLFPKFVREILCIDRFSMNLIIPTGTAAINDKLTVRYSEIGKYLERIIVESKNHNVNFMWYSPVPMCLFNSIPNGLGNKGCSACDGLISIAPNGDVLPCASYDESVGNLLKQDFKTIWHSVNAVKFRTKSLANDICKSCEDFHICNGACPLYWRKVGFEELK